MEPVQRLESVQYSTRIPVEVSQWLRTATPEDIANALVFGHAAAVALSERRQRASVDIGKSGELQVEEILTRRFGDVTNVTKCPRSGDLSLTLAHRKVLIEVKNYTSAVPTSGIEKFQRDLGSTGACAGVFVSLKSRITGVTADFTLRDEYTESGSVPCAYLVGDTDHSIITAVMMVSKLAGARAHMRAVECDLLSSAAGAITEGLEGAKKARGQMQACIRDIVDNMVRGCGQLVLSEHTIACAVDQLRQDMSSLCATECDLAIELAGSAAYSRYPPPVRSRVLEHVSTLCKLHPDTPWKITARKCSHSTGVEFSFPATGPLVLVPRELIPRNTVLDLIDDPSLRGLVTIGDYITVSITDATAQCIHGLLNYQ